MDWLLESVWALGAIGAVGGASLLGLVFFLLRRRQGENLIDQVQGSVDDSVSESEETPASLDSALKNTKNQFMGRLQSLFSSKSELSSEDSEELEEILYTSDLGPKTVQKLHESIDEHLQGSEKSDLSTVSQVMRQSMLDIFAQVSDDLEEEFALEKLNKNSQGLSIWMVVGVNGAGKTTTIGKLAAKMAAKGQKVLVAAGDTFRAAADSQLKVWTERAGVEIFSPEGVKDPSAVAFDACQMAQSRGFDLLIIDTAGRLHTQSNLMEELKKMKRVVQKVVPEGPHETLIVLDANSGQNAIVQAKQFHDALSLSGAILTKLDGSAKGGVAVGLACDLELPVRLIGVGEGISDLRGFAAKEFVNSIL